MNSSENPCDSKTSKLGFHSSNLIDSCFAYSYGYAQLPKLKTNMVFELWQLIRLQKFFSPEQNFKIINKYLFLGYLAFIYISGWGIQRTANIPQLFQFTLETLLLLPCTLVPRVCAHLRPGVSTVLMIHPCIYPAKSRRGDTD